MITITKAVSRKTSGTVRDGSKRRPLVITIHPGDTLTLRPLGTRREEVIDIYAAYDWQMKRRVAEERAAKKAKKKGGLK